MMMTQCPFVTSEPFYVTDHDVKISLVTVDLTIDHVDWL